MSVRAAFLVGEVGEGKIARAERGRNGIRSYEWYFKGVPIKFDRTAHFQRDSVEPVVCYYLANVYSICTHPKSA